MAGYSELSKAGRDLVQPLTRQHGGDGGFVVCLGLGGLVDLEEVLSLDPQEDEGAQPMDHGVEVWVVDSRRPWNLQNVFGSGVAGPNDQPAINDEITKRRRGVIQLSLIHISEPTRPY